jgi:hypothetical protein
VARLGLSSCPATLRAVHLAVRGYGSRRFKLHVYAVRSSPTLDLPRRWLRIEEFTNGNALLRCSYVQHGVLREFMEPTSMRGNFFFERWQSGEEAAPEKNEADSQMCKTADRDERYRNDCCVWTHECP